jgi:hypothetical protein
MQSSSSSSTLTREEQEKLLTPHEYIGDASMGYKDCILCRHRTEFTCVKCGYCYSCHWKKEQMEEIESRDNLKDFLLSLSKDGNENSQELKSQKQEENKSTTRSESEKWGTLDVLGQPAEPICTYYRCHHKFSLHGSRRCRCKHPTNKALGIFVRHH